MGTLTKEQRERLTPEQQADLAKLELGRAERRVRLLKRARQSQFDFIMQRVGFAIALMVGAYVTFPLPIFLCIGVLLVVVYSEINSLGRRIDALLKLYETNDYDDA